MVKKRQSRSYKTDEHTTLHIEVSRFEVSADASLNFALQNTHSPFDRPDDLAYQFAMTLNIDGVCIAPSGRAGELYHLIVIGKGVHANSLSYTLEDFQARDENGAPKYRSYRGERIPVYDGPRGISRLSRGRGAKKWEAWFWFQPQLVSDMLFLLTHMKPLYVSLHEHREGRDRWVKDFTLQTSRPDEEEAG